MGDMKHFGINARSDTGTEEADMAEDLLTITKDASTLRNMTNVSPNVYCQPNTVFLIKI